MNKKEFNKLSINNQVIYFNKLLKQGYSGNKICKNIIKIARSTVRDRFKTHGYTYDKKDNQYVNGYDNNINITHKNNISVKRIKEQNENISIGKNSYNQNKSFITPIELPKLKNLINSEEQIYKMLEWFEKEKDILENRELQISKDILDDKKTTRSFTVNTTILKEFIKYCKNHKQYTQKDILSFALRNLMDNFK